MKASGLVGGWTTALLLGMAMMMSSSLTQAQGRGLAVVSSEKDHALTLVDLNQQAVVGTIATCKRPRHLRQWPGTTQVLVACGDSGQADLIDVKTQRSIRRIPLGEDPEIFDISPDGRTLFVSNEEDAEVGLFEAATGRKLGAIKVGEEPEGVLLSRDGRTLYVTSEVAGLVHVVDVASRKIVKDIPVGQRPRRLALTPDGHELWVTQELDASVGVIDTRRQALTGTVKFELKGARSADITPVGLSFSPDGRTAFVALGRANHVAFVEVASRRTLAMVLVGQRAWGLATDRVGQRLHVVNGLSDDMTIVDIATAKPLKTIRVGRVPHSVVVIEP